MRATVRRSSRGHEPFPRRADDDGPAPARSLRALRGGAGAQCTRAPSRRPPVLVRIWASAGTVRSIAAMKMLPRVFLVSLLALAPTACANLNIYSDEELEPLSLQAYEEATKETGGKI